jgi:hypothetical protein
MSGRIKLLKNGAPINETDVPPLEFVYDTPSDFDKECGTYGLDNYQLPNIECPDTFVCLEDVTDPALVSYATCIPHHRNAVNMAKVLLKQNILVCDDLTNQEDPDCKLEVCMLLF